MIAYNGGLESLFRVLDITIGLKVYSNKVYKISSGV